MDFTGLPTFGWESLAPYRDVIEAALISAIATLVLTAGLLPRLGSQPRNALSEDSTDVPDCEFLINGAHIKPCTEPARAMLDRLGVSGGGLAALGSQLANDCPGIQKDLEALVLYGTAFRHHCPREDGTAIEILGEPRGSAAFLGIRPASEDARALRRAQADLDAARAENRFLRDVLDHAPVAAWSITPDGQVTWANAAYRERFDGGALDMPGHRIPNAFGHVLDEVPLTARGGGSRRRVSIAGRQDRESNWFEVSQSTGAEGETLGFALSADDLVAAEASLRRFIETLTETFAHLPIGLAVFDKNRRLGLFNPALTDLVRIDAVWLAGRPSLRDFLERLRETRQMPDQKDFASWRRKLGELEEGARDGTYEENWVLPSGKIFRVTGRPHPQGALAFLFEDISTSIQLERKYRLELELGQATLDRMIEAVAVFDMSGMLVFVNSAFEELWGLAPLDRLDGPGVGEMTRLCAERCLASPVWGQIAEFATAAESRTSWTAEVETLDGRSLHLLVAPLPDTSSLVVFRDLTAERAELRNARDHLTAFSSYRESAAAIRDLALEQVQLPAEQAVRQLASVLPSAQSPEAFQSLRTALQSLQDGLARSRELRDLARSANPATEGPLTGLATALRNRGLTFVPCPDAAAWGADLRRVALALGLAATEIAEPGAEVAMSAETRLDRRRIMATTSPASLNGRPEGLSTAVARRVIESVGGTLRIVIDGGSASLIADLASLPETQPATAEEPRLIGTRGA